RVISLTRTDVDLKICLPDLDFQVGSGQVTEQQIRPTISSKQHIRKLTSLQIKPGTFKQISQNNYQQITLSSSRTLLLTLKRNNQQEENIYQNKDTHQDEDTCQEVIANK
ncbi:6519_t:CDS:2, partial [Funneliformis geosporum]